MIAGKVCWISLVSFEIKTEFLAEATSFPFVSKREVNTVIVLSELLKFWISVVVCKTACSFEVDLSFQIWTPKDATRTSLVITKVTGLKIPIGCEPSENPHSPEHPPQTQGKSAMKAGWAAFTTILLLALKCKASVMSKVKVVRPPLCCPTSFPFTQTVA